jgi:hypothetical protein
MNKFIKEQQEEYGEWDIEVDGVKYAGKRTIQNVITNTGAEIMRRMEDGDKEFSLTDSRYIKKDTTKQHIKDVIE